VVIGDRTAHADIVVVNTCTVTAESTRSSRQLIKRTVREFPGASVVVTGCYAAAQPDEVLSIGGVDLVVPNKDKDRLVDAVAEQFGNAGSVQSAGMCGRSASACPPATALQLRPRSARQEPERESRAWTVLPVRLTQPEPSYACMEGCRGEAPGNGAAALTQPEPSYAYMEALATASDRGIDGRPEDPSLREPRRTLKVQTGCDELCSFCIVPSTRGGLQSRPYETVLELAQKMVNRGAVEITLSGVHLGKYGVDIGYEDGLYGLVCRLLDALPSHVRLRLSSIEATCLDVRLVELMNRDKRLCRHLHIPLQSGDDEVLSAMRRPYDSDTYLRIVEAAREKVDGLALTTDVMVGFPGETPKALWNTYRLIERVGFAKLHVFRYSPRQGTPAASFDAQVSEVEKKSRSRMIRELGDELRRKFFEREVSRGVLSGVLIEGSGVFDDDPANSSAARSKLFGITDNYIKVVTVGPADKVGGYVDVIPTGWDAEKVEGELKSQRKERPNCAFV
jgi:threonylcarbamoyladenosine tRNA methylthiotransferase MtaB